MTNMHGTLPYTIFEVYIASLIELQVKVNKFKTYLINERNKTILTIVQYFSTFITPQ